MKWQTEFKVGEYSIGKVPTYFIADIGANHDGSLDRALMLIEQAARAFANCVKFQHFRAKDIVSDYGFRKLGQVAHQRDWDKPVYEVYQDYSINREWDARLEEKARECGVHFMTTPYDAEAIASVDPLVPAYKIGSGDITFLSHIEKVAKMGKPTFLATGAARLSEVNDAVIHYLHHNDKLCLMQCNTNYTGSHDNFHYINLNVLRTYKAVWPSMPLGLSDHTPGYVAVLGAVALGARAIEKHFTDDTTRRGPDHKFALDPGVWEEMVVSVRRLEEALGDGHKKVEANEEESVVVQRRALRARHNILAGDKIAAHDLEALRPCPAGALTPAQLDLVVGKIACGNIVSGQELYLTDIK